MMATVFILIWSPGNSTQIIRQAYVLQTNLTLVVLNLETIFDKMKDYFQIVCQIYIINVTQICVICHIIVNSKRIDVYGIVLFRLLRNCTTNTNILYRVMPGNFMLRPHHFWTYTSNLTTVVNSVLKFMISGTTSILKS